MKTTLLEWVNYDAGILDCYDETTIYREKIAVEHKEYSEEEEPVVQLRVSHETSLKHVNGLLDYIMKKDDGIIGDKLSICNLQDQIKINLFWN